jgi:KOW motif
MKIGDLVRMTEGPFLGMQGTIVSSNRRRVVLAVALGSREVQLEIDADSIGTPFPLRGSTARIEPPALKPAHRLLT